MIQIEEATKKIRKFKALHGLGDQADEHIVTTIHLMSKHRLDLHSAQDQTSKGSHDHGIDGWAYDADSQTLYFYQSKLGTSRTHVLSGCKSIRQSSEWLERILISHDGDSSQPNAAIYNLVLCLSKNLERVRKVKFFLLSVFDENELEDDSDVSELEQGLQESRLNKHLSSLSGSIDLKIETYCLEGLPPPSTKEYPVKCLDLTKIALREKSTLDVKLGSLRSLVELYRRRGDALFEKNVRLYLGGKDARDRVEHPMQTTLKAICEEKSLSPSIFTYYHVGIAITGSSARCEGDDLLIMNPSIINGCQTVHIADDYLDNLQKRKAQEAIDRFSAIGVLTKVIVGANDDELREIANCNNRQNPIEGWQLYCNEPIHSRIEDALRDIGIFYERQKGKFAAALKNLRMGDYQYTNNTSVTVPGLAQLICLGRNRLQEAAKPQLIFARKETHDAVFDTSIPNRPRDIVWAFNAYKAIRRALENHLRQPSHDNDQTHSIFNRPMVRWTIYYLCLADLYQRRIDTSKYFIFKLNKNAASSLVAEVAKTLHNLVLKTKKWYLEESKQLSVEVSSKKLGNFTITAATELGLDLDGPMPFTNRALDWTDIEKKIQQEQGDYSEEDTKTSDVDSETAQT